MNYLAMNKKAYEFFKAARQFRPYIPKKRIKVVVPHHVVRSLFVQKELGERRGNWVTVLEEYDLEFKLITIIKGQGLCKLIEENRTNKDSDWEKEAGVNLIDVCPIFTTLESWYSDIVYYLQQVYLLEHWNSEQRRELILN